MNSVPALCRKPSFADRTVLPKTLFLSGKESFFRTTANTGLGKKGERKFFRPTSELGWLRNGKRADLLKLSFVGKNRSLNGNFQIGKTE